MTPYGSTWRPTAPRSPHANAVEATLASDQAKPRHRPIKLDVGNALFDDLVHLVRLEMEFR